MNAAFSPGKWKINRAGDYTGDPTQKQILSITAADGATVLYTDSGYYKPKEANARLIAAAPDLYNALTAIIEAADFGSEEGAMELGERLLEIERLATAAQRAAQPD